ncbi:LacI family DNA-binding transcriptional regulator [Gordonia sp. DT30]|uniref:LacI family DNA-binding transcriptional regulator n=1 Tax=Gordonia sp. DT30 TaxID=3416546 RepID=UPI003CEDFB5D
MGEKKPRPTIADVAARSGVSRTTVSMALNGKGRIDPATRERVRVAAAELNYRASVRAQRLRGGRAHSIALITALPATIVGEASHQGFLLDLALPAAQFCLESGYSLVLVPPLETEDHLDALDIDGAIVIDPEDDDRRCNALAQRGVQVVTIGAADGVDAAGVIDRGLGGADVMIDHLERNGARDIVVLSSAESYPIKKAVLTYTELKAAHPKSERPITVAFAPAAAGEKGGEDAALEILSGTSRPDAIYAPLDAFAVGVARAAARLGIAVPDELMVATNYDGRRANLVQPPLTALDLHLPEMAHAAASLLLSILEDDDDTTESPRVVTAPVPTVVARGSTGRMKAVAKQSRESSRRA